MARCSPGANPFHQGKCIQKLKEAALSIISLITMCVDQLIVFYRKLDSLVY